MYILAFLAGIIGYGAIARDWLDVPDKVDIIDTNVQELLRLETHRIFTLIPEERVAYSSFNPRVFEIEVPPNAVTEPTTFEFDQRPVLSLPISLPQDYDFSGWSAAFSPKNVELLEPFTTKVQLEPWENPGDMSILYWSSENMIWQDVPVSVMKDSNTGKYVLTFTSKDVGLYALVVK